MGISVKITTPMPTLDEVAKELGISGKRRRDLERIMEEATRSLDIKRSRRPAAMKNRAPRSMAA